MGGGVGVTTVLQNGSSGNKLHGQTIVPGGNLHRIVGGMVCVKKWLV